MKVVILATGGTIAGSAASNTQTTGYKAGAIGVQTLINAVPEMSKIAHVEGEHVSVLKRFKSIYTRTKDT